MLMIQEVIEENPELVHERDVFGNTPIFYATSKEAVELLLKHNASLFETNNYGEGVVASIISEPSYRSSVVLYLIEEGAPLPLPGQQAIRKACRSEGIKLLNIFYDNGFSLEETNARGETPLLFLIKKLASERKKETGRYHILFLMIESLLAMNANPFIEDNKGDSPKSILEKIENQYQLNVRKENKSFLNRLAKFIYFKKKDQRFERRLANLIFLVKSRAIDSSV